MTDTPNDPAPARTNAPASPAEPDAVSSPAPKRRRKTRWVWYAVYVVLLLEIGSRVYWVAVFDVPFFRMQDIPNAFYPQIRDSGILDEDLTADDGYFDILLLGGSVLHNDFGKIEPLLRKKLFSRTSGRARLWNVAYKAHTSRDSLLKFRQLADKHFDLVVFYHGINEARMNNCTREMFKADYSHCAWYRAIERVKSHPELPVLSLPWTLEFLTIQILSSPAIGEYLPTYDVVPGTEELGEDIKSAESFRANLAEILSMASERGEHVMLMSFAHHIPPKPDPGLKRYPVTIWGTREGVRATIEAHNDIVKELARTYDNVIYVDQHAMIPHNYDMFDDPCHLSAEGSVEFVDNLSDELFDLISRH